MLLKHGSKGSKVKQIQEALGLPADGIFGGATKLAVMKFQSQNGLDSDGLVGPATWEILIGVDTDETGTDWNAATDRDNKLERLGKYTTKDGLEIDRAYLDGDEFVRDYGKIEPLGFFYSSHSRLG